MLRFGLAIYLMLVIAAGPWLCCCAVADLTRWFPTTTETPASPCCCCQTTTEPEETNLPVPAKPSPGNCPCQQQRTEPIALPAGVSHSTDLLASLELVAGPGLLPLTQPGSQALPASALEGHSISPFLDPQSLLRAFHLLRC